MYMYVLGPEAPKQLHIIILPPPCFTEGLLLSNKSCLHVTKQLRFGLLRLKDKLPELILLMFQMFSPS